MVESVDLGAKARAFFAAYSRHDVEQMVALCDLGLDLNYVPEGEDGRGGLETARRFWTTFTELIPDFRVDVQRIMSGDGFVVAETIQGGTPARDIGPVKAKGGASMAPHCYLIRFSDTGLITQMTCYWDYNLIYMQLGHTEVHR